MIERIKLSSLLETHFCVLDNEPRSYSNKRFKSLRVETWKTKNRAKQTMNVIQCRDYHVRKELQFQHAEYFHPVALSLIEDVIDQIDFGLGDIRPKANYLILGCDRPSSPAKIVSWLRKNCSGDVVVIEGSKRVRISFDRDEDYLLTKLGLC